MLAQELASRYNAILDGPQPHPMTLDEMFTDAWGQCDQAATETFDPWALFQFVMPDGGVLFWSDDRSAGALRRFVAGSRADAEAHAQRTLRNMGVA